MKPLHLTLTKQWFSMILSGEKREEYREIKPYWTKRLTCDKKYSTIIFKNGYATDAPTMEVELLEIAIGEGNPLWGGESGIEYYVLKLGKVLSHKNTKSNQGNAK